MSFVVAAVFCLLLTFICYAVVSFLVCPVLFGLVGKHGSPLAKSEIIAFSISHRYPPNTEPEGYWTPQLDPLRLQNGKPLIAGYKSKYMSTPHFD